MTELILVVTRIQPEEVQDVPHAFCQVTSFLAAELVAAHQPVEGGHWAETR